jgi:poly-gamma-glutamate synthesis protein (capsule biosynthesis protein)
MAYAVAVVRGDKATGSGRRAKWNVFLTAAVAAVVVGSGGIVYGVVWMGDTTPSKPVGDGGGATTLGGVGDGAPPPPSPRRDAQGRRLFTVLAAGDVLVHPEVSHQARLDARAAGKSDGFDFFPMLRHVSPAIAQADLAICHMEIPLGKSDGPFEGFPRFNGPPHVTQAVKRAGFDACSTASNHTIDQGEEGVVRTLDAFDAVGIGHAGSARSAKEAGTTTIYQQSGVKVGHLSYTLHFNGLDMPAGKDWLANVIEPQKITAAARRARAAGAEIVVLSVHWGTEYQHLPDADQEKWAKPLIGSPDIDLILGHHAHVVQPFEKFGEKWVVYGMGNQLARHAEPVDDNREGVMARITFTQVGPKRWKTTQAEALPTWVDVNPHLRLVDLSAALADPATPDTRRAIYQAAYDRIKGYLIARGGDRGGLRVAASRS